ncbi:MAG: FAD-binding oxidoreductase [Solirubrobacterales bacterium]
MPAQAKLIYRGDDDYERARAETAWNAHLPDRFPAAIMLAESAEDVVAAVRYARESGLTVKARSGGHSWTASGIREGSVLVDLSRLRSIELDLEAGTATVGPGVEGHELNNLLAPHGLFFPTGHCSTVGLGGFLLQGGWGWNSRAIGPACLSVEGVEVVTAAGELIVADREQNTDFWWAARGAGSGYFAIVTKFLLRLHERPKAMMRSHYTYSLDDMDAVLHWAARLGPTLPPRLEYSMVATTPRGLDGEPGDGGAAIVLTGRALMDTEEEARAALAELETCPVLDRALAKTAFIPTSFEDLYARSDAVEPEGYRWCADNIWTDAPAEEIVPAVRELFTTIPNAISHVLWYQWNPQEFPEAAISVQGNLYLGAYTGWTDPAEDAAMLAWPRGQMERLQHLSNGIQLADENLVARRDRYLSPENEARLEALRAEHDPDGRILGYLFAAEVR